jgi:hypothetical protein
MAVPAPTAGVGAITFGAAQAEKNASASPKPQMANEIATRFVNTIGSPFK